MKRTVSVLLAVLMLLMCGCGSKKVKAADNEDSVSSSVSLETLKQPVSTIGFFMDIRHLDRIKDDTAICRVEYPVLKLSLSDGEKYPTLKRSIDNINNAFIQNGQSMFNQLALAAETAFSANSEDFVQYTRKSSLAIPRADSKVVSILCSSSVYTGGEHEDITYSCLNCDTVSGREMDIRSVVNDMPAFRTVLETSLQKDYPDVEFNDLIGSLNRYMEDPGQFVWTLDYQGISVFFSPCELADYSAGLLSVSLRFDNYPELLSQSYAEVPSSYAVPIVDGKCRNYDLDLNAASDVIEVTDSYNEELGYSDVLNISVNGHVTSTKTGLRSYDCYVIHAGLGRDYLFINGENLSEYGYINVFRLDRTGASFVGGLYDTSLHAAAFSGYCEGRTVLTNPESFIMGTECKLLCRQVGIKTYYISTDGMPVSNDNYYLLSSSSILTNKNELATVSIDPNTGSGNQSAVKIPAKTQFYFWRTDGSSFVDMKTSSGICCRLFITVKNKTQYVNGVNAGDILDGID